MTGTQKTMPKKKKAADQSVMPPVRQAKNGVTLRPVQQVIRPVVREILPHKSVIFQQVFDMWPDIAAGTAALGTVPEKLVFARQQQRDGVLHLWSQSSAQAVELTYQRGQLVQRINALFGYALVADIKVTANPRTLMAGKPKANPKKVNSSQAVSSQSLDKILGGISNPALRTILGELGSVLPVQPIDNLIDNKDSKGETNE